MTMHDPEIEITCDGEGCEESLHLRLSATGRGWNEHGLDKKIENNGWHTEGDLHYCEDCYNARNEDDNTQHLDDKQLLDACRRRGLIK